MAFAEHLLPEFDHEMQTTRSLLERVPFTHPDWKPHGKSTPLAALASHIANLAGFGALIANQDGLTFGGPTGPQPAPPFANSSDLLAAFDANVAKSRAAIAAVDESKLGDTWTLKAGDHTIFALPKRTVFRSMLMNHIIHHRGQLSVYLRLNDVPLPSIYGPTADT